MNKNLATNHIITIEYFLNGTNSRSRVGNVECKLLGEDVKGDVAIQDGSKWVFLPLMTRWKGP
jgi:hypothetical protein